MTKNCLSCLNSGGYRYSCKIKKYLLCRHSSYLQTSSKMKSYWVSVTERSKPSTIILALKPPKTCDYQCIASEIGCVVDRGGKECKAFYRRLNNFLGFFSAQLRDKLKNKNKKYKCSVCSREDVATKKIVRYHYWNLQPCKGSGKNPVIKKGA